MKKVLIILFFTLFLSACSVKATPLPATLTPITAPTATNIPTIALTTTPTATATPEANWSLEIPATPEQCTNVIRSDSFENTTKDVTSLNTKIMGQKWFWNLPAGEFPPRTQQTTIKPWEPSIQGDDAPFSLVRIEMWYNANNQDGSPIDTVVTSCSKYKDGYLFGTFIEINKQMIPIQIFIDPEILQDYIKDYSAHGQDSRQFVQRLLEDYQLRNSKTWQSSINFYGEFDKYTKYKDSATGLLGNYLDTKYNYSERIKRLLTGIADTTEAQETIEIIKNNPIPGYLRLNQQ